ncbi:serine/threonine-protein kinase pim-1-like [Triplophysa dalaica]|uniref:serine/threonine-protein kinase pim-1-like n=1 Tax=Triplophysa dalaica TaxID=1582913 RepID=UPI0024DF3B6F|nr:serine/threonine-protein kinase pim-1-like [Triplophysa dalaica]
MASSSNRVSPNDMERNTGTFSSLYEKGKFIGAGICANVFEGIRRSDGQVVASKHFSCDSVSKYMKIPGHDKLLLTEVAINFLLHKPVKCPNIVQILDWFVEDGKHIVIMEYPYPCKTLNEFLRSHQGRLKETEARHIMRQAVSTAKHCIDHNIAHGDLHRGNVLITMDKLELKLIDFGFSHLIPDTASEVRTKAVADMVKFLSNLLFLLTTGDERHSFHGPDLLDNPRLKAFGLSKECLDLMNRCRHLEAADWPTLEDLLDHKWFKPH